MNTEGPWDLNWRMGSQQKKAGWTIAQKGSKKGAVYKSKKTPTKRYEKISWVKEKGKDVRTKKGRNKVIGKQGETQDPCGCRFQKGAREISKKNGFLKGQRRVTQKARQIHRTGDQWKCHVKERDGHARKSKKEGKSLNGPRLNKTKHVMERIPKGE